mmetsp:Transcript_26687/g.56185  ORF Transcript_26687/g.56185 Transcript_26687/m.56185 type:complete len:369 (-) Transcript_26687:194-1300(-)
MAFASFNSVPKPTSSPIGLRSTRTSRRTSISSKSPRGKSCARKTSFTSPSAAWSGRRTGTIWASRSRGTPKAKRRSTTTSSCFGSINPEFPWKCSTSKTQSWPLRGNPKDRDSPSSTPKTPPVPKSTSPFTICGSKSNPTKRRERTPPPTPTITNNPSSSPKSPKSKLSKTNNATASSGVPPDAPSSSPPSATPPPAHSNSTTSTPDPSPSRNTTGPTKSCGIPPDAPSPRRSLNPSAEVISNSLWTTGTYCGPFRGSRSTRRVSRPFTNFNGVPAKNCRVRPKSTRLPKISKSTRGNSPSLTRRRGGGRGWRRRRGRGSCGASSGRLWRGCGSGGPGRRWRGWSCWEDMIARMRIISWRGKLSSRLF